MAAYSKTLLLIFSAVFCIFGQIQSQKIITIDYCTVDADNPVVMLDTIGIIVHVLVDDTSVTDDNTLFGDLFYWYQTDSMATVNINFRRAINNDLNMELIPDGGIIDTVYVDLRPEEIRTSGPVNVMCLWPAMSVAGVDDTIPCCSNFVFNITGTEILNQITSSILYPNPSESHIFIREDEMISIQQLTILSIEGKTLLLYTKEELAPGFINIENLNAGGYILELFYQDKSAKRVKIFKR